MTRSLLWLAVLTLLAAAPPAAIAQESDQNEVKTDKREVKDDKREVKDDKSPDELSNPPAAEKKDEVVDLLETPDLRPGELRKEEPAPPKAQAGTERSWLDEVANWLMGGAVLLALLLIGSLLLRHNRKRIERLETRFDNLTARVVRLESAAAPAPAPAPAPADALRDTLQRRSTRIGGYETGSSGWDDAPPSPPPSRQWQDPRPARAPGDHGAPPVPRPPAPTALLASLQEELARLIAAPAMRTADYDALLRRHGELHGYEVSDESGSGRLTPIDGDPHRQLVALALADSPIVAVLPSARFVREFVLYKERLEVGNDVKAVFDLTADGSAQLRIEALAHGRVTPDGRVFSPDRGLLGGFLR